MHLRSGHERQIYSNLKEKSHRLTISMSLDYMKHGEPGYDPKRLSGAGTLNNRIDFVSYLFTELQSVSISTMLNWQICSIMNRYSATTQSVFHMPHPMSFSMPLLLQPGPRRSDAKHKIICWSVIPCIVISNRLILVRSHSERNWLVSIAVWLPM